jgi:hypothetical protein
MLLALMLKKVVLQEVATALASSVLPAWAAAKHEHACVQWKNSVHV